MNQLQEKTVKRTRPELMFLVAAFSAFLATFNETFLNVAFTPIMSDLNVGVNTVQWISTAYMLGAAVMVPISAFLYRSIPTKPLYLSTVGLLVVGSVVGALAPNFTVLLIGRIIQSFGTGMMIPIAMNITLTVAPKRKIGTYIGIMGAMTTLGPSLSIILAGAILSVGTWHTMMWFFAALSFLCFLCGVLFMGNVAELTHPKMDFPSPILVGLSLVALLYGISTIFSGNVILALALIIIGGILMVLFVKRQNKLEQPLINLKPLKIKAFAIGVVINIIVLIIIFGMNIVTPMFLQGGLGVSAMVASLTLFPAILLSCVVSPIAGRIYDKRGAKALLPIGFVLVLLASAALALMPINGIIAVLLLYVPIFIGSYLIIGPIQSLALSHLSPETNAHGVTVLSTGFQVAGCIGASLFSGVYGKFPAVTDGFTATSLLAAVIALIGIGFALRENRLSTKTPEETKQTKPATAVTATDLFSMMKEDAFSVLETATVRIALEEMVNNKISGLPVVDSNGNLKAFISDGDIIRFMIGKDSENYSFASMYPLWHNASALESRLVEMDKISVMELATKKVVSVKVTDNFEVLFKVFGDWKIKKLPVVDNGKLVGTISRSDLIRRLIAK